MRSVVITRPASPTSDRANTDALSTTLMQAGLTTYHLPTLSLTALHSPEDEIRISNHWQKYTVVMLVSQHAAQFAHQHMTRLGLSWSPNTWLAAVGQGTLHTLQQLWPQHHRVIHPANDDTADTEGLWRAITAQPELHTPQNLLIIRAQQGRDTLLHLAQQADWQTDIWRCYQRNLRQWCADEMVQFNQACSTSCVVLITSIEGLKALTQQLNPEQLRSAQQQTIVTLHTRIAEYARQAGFSDVYTYAPCDLAAGIIELAQ